MAKFRVQFWADHKGRRLLYEFVVDAERLVDATAEAWVEVREREPRADELVRRGERAR